MSNARKAAVFVRKIDASIATHVVVLGRDGNIALMKNTKTSCCRRARGVVRFASLKPTIARTVKNLAVRGLKKKDTASQRILMNG